MAHDKPGAEYTKAVKKAHAKSGGSPRFQNEHIKAIKSNYMLTLSVALFAVVKKHRCLTTLLALCLLPSLSLAAVQLPEPKADPSALTENQSTPVTFTVPITDSTLIPGSVYLQRLDNDTNKIVGSWAMRGTGNQVFTVTVTLKEPPGSFSRFRVSAAFRGQLKRTFSPTIVIVVHASETVMNAAADFWGLNLGDNIALWWADLPFGTTQEIIYRSSTPTGPWTQIFQLKEEEGSPTSMLDTVDGTAQNWYYRMDALDVNGVVVKSYGILRVPKDSPPTPAPSGNKYDATFMSNTRFQDKQAMDVDQIRALFEYFGSGWWDSFSVSISPVEYWRMGYTDPVDLPFFWGGRDYLDHISERDTAGGKTLTIDGASYINVVLDTVTQPDADNNYPSWGMIKMVEVTPKTPVSIDDNP